MKDEPELPPELRALEERLRDVEPAPLRDEFRRRLLTRWSALRPARWLAVAAVLLLAATVVWILNRTQPVDRTIARPHPDEAQVELRGSTPPTWLAYTRAAAESPEELDRLLNTHDRRLLQSVPALEKSIPM